MTKSDFLDKLRYALSGKVSDSLIRENMTYYSEYIDSQVSMGRSEQEVMEMLGDPRLIARTIIQTNGTESNSAHTVEDSFYRENTSQDDTAYSGAAYDDPNNNSGSSYYERYQNGGNELKVRTIPGWLWTIIVIAIIICLISFVFSVVSFLLPIVLPVLIVLFLVKLFRDWLN